MQITSVASCTTHDAAMKPYKMIDFHLIPLPSTTPTNITHLSNPDIKEMKSG